MVNEAGILDEISVLIQKGTAEDDLKLAGESQDATGFIIVPLSLILPAGNHRAIACDSRGNIVGVKLSLNFYKGVASEIFIKLCQLEHLQRIVFFCSNPFDVPAEIRNLKKLTSLWVGTQLRTLPKEVLDLDLPFVRTPEDPTGEVLDRVVSEKTRKFLRLLRGLTDSNESTPNRPLDKPRETYLIEHGRLSQDVEDELSALSGIFLEVDQLEDPPLEIAMRGRDAVVRYFQQRREGDLPLNELKVILVGNGGSGKTSLVKRIFGEGFDPKEPQTHGINIRQRDIQTPTRQVKLHFWDFGGQEIMHATHQFFLSKRCIYILVLDGRKDEDPEYWLQHVQSFGGDSPILLVLNRVDEHPALSTSFGFLARAAQVSILS